MYALIKLFRGSLIRDYSLLIVQHISRYYGCTNFRINMVRSLSIGIIRVNTGRDLLNEPVHDKNNKMACAATEDSYQPGHPPSLIRVFAMCSVGS